MVFSRPVPINTVSLLHRKMVEMWIAYVDESSGDEKSFMTLAALVCPVDKIEAVAIALDEIVLRASHLYGTRLDSEIHASEIIGRSGEWAMLPDATASIEIIEGVVDALCTIEGVEFFMRGVNVKAHRAKEYPETWNPRRVGIQHVLEKCNEYLRTPGSLLVIVDEMAKPDEHRQLLKLYRAKGTPGFRKSKLKTIVDNIYFMPSHYARGLQGADVLAYAHRRQFTISESTDQRAQEVSSRIWAKLVSSGKVRAYGTWPN
jgi:hypothetical protein